MESRLRSKMIHHGALVMLLGMAVGFPFASVIAAVFGVRGLAPVGPAANLAVYAIFMVAVFAVIAGLVLLAGGARAAARAQEPGPAI